MSYSTGTRGLLLEVLSWTAAVGIIAAAVINFDSLKLSIRQAVGDPTSDGKAASAKLLDDDVAAQPVQTGVVELKLGRNGHFATEAEINGRPINVLVDTGATNVALSYEDAERAGIFLKPSDFTHQASTANGVARVAPVVIDRITIGDITVRDVQAGVLQQGKLESTLLGMSFLSRLSRVEMRPGSLILHD